MAMGSGHAKVPATRLTLSRHREAESLKGGQLRAV